MSFSFILVKSVCSFPIPPTSAWGNPLIHHCREASSVSPCPGGYAGRHPLDPQPQVSSPPPQPTTLFCFPDLLVCDPLPKLTMSTRGHPSQNWALQSPLNVCAPVAPFPHPHVLAMSWPGTKRYGILSHTGAFNHLTAFTCTSAHGWHMKEFPS